jgi:hypothetical protein
MRKLAIAMVLVVLGGAWQAQGATVVTMWLVTPNATNWQLFVQDTNVGSFGLYSISATIIGANTSGIGHLTVTGPTGQIVEDSGANLGFSGKIEAATTNGLNFSIYQPLSVNDPGEYCYHFGQTAGTFSSQLSNLGTPQGMLHDAFTAPPVMIAKGRMASGVIPTLFQNDLSAFIFINKSSMTSGNATLKVPVVIGPEPASLALLGLGSVLILGPRRKRRRA